MYHDTINNVDDIFRHVCILGGGGGNSLWLINGQCGMSN